VFVDEVLIIGDIQRGRGQQAVVGTWG
jgi:hypothetical protein